MAKHPPTVKQDEHPIGKTDRTEPDRSTGASRASRLAYPALYDVLDARPHMLLASRQCSQHDDQNSEQRLLKR